MIQFRLLPCHPSTKRSITALLMTLFILTGCAPQTRVMKINDDLYKITETGGWGYDLNSLESEVHDQARLFASSAGKDLEVLDESVVPDTHVDVYPADDDTYSLTFRLIQRNNDSKR